jgi:hypothetical protein
MNIGASNKLIYDECDYQKRLYESTSPLAYNLFFGAQENCEKCRPSYQPFWVKYDPQIVDVESELLNITRPLSNCDQFKYSPACKRSGLCISTFDKSMPVVLAPEVCPIVYNNIPRQTSKGYRLPSANICGAGAY